MNFEDIILREINQSQEDKYCSIPLIWVTSQIQRQKIKWGWPGQGIVDIPLHINMAYVIEHRILHALCLLLTFKWHLMLLFSCLFCCCCYWSFPMTIHWRHCEWLNLRFLDHDKLHSYLIWRKHTEHSRFWGHLPHDTDLGFSKLWDLGLSTFGHS